MLFSAQLCKLPLQCWYFDWQCSEQFATGSNNLLVAVANLLAHTPHQIPHETVNISWNSPKMISHGRKSDEKSSVEELARFTVVIKEFCIVGWNIICCCLIFVFIFILEVTR